MPRGRKGGNPDVVSGKVGRKFQKGNTVSRDTNAQPYSIRRQYQDLMRYPMPSTLPEVEAALIKWQEIANGKGKVYAARQIVARAYVKLLLQMEVTMLNTFTDNVDGKLPETVYHENGDDVPEDGKTPAESLANFKIAAGKE